MSNWEKKFSFRPMQKLAEFLQTKLIDDPNFLAVGEGASPNFDVDTAATALINGARVELAAEVFEMNNTARTDCAGETVATAYEVWLAFFMDANSVGYCKKASDITLTATGATLKVPDYDATILVPVALVKYVNDSGSPFVIGTTNVVAGDYTIYDLTSDGGMLTPLFPHSDNWDKN